MSTLKQRTAGTLKWNVIDRVSTQLLYAVTGIVLARVLSQEDFGLVGAVLVFQAFASLLVDSGFGHALLQRKAPTQLDYSTILWFNMLMSVLLYAVAWVCAPLIADCFGGDRRIVGLTRVMFLALPVNSSSSVQCYRLIKRMDVKMIAVANSLGIMAGAIAGISLALKGFGAWAIVWQTIVLSVVKSGTLWLTERWRPSMVLRLDILRSYWTIGSRMLFTSFMNTLFQNVYSFFVGNRSGLVSLGYYTQSDKWSKMGVSSISQVLTSSFLPTLSAVQDEPERFRHIVARMNRFTGYLLFPATLGLAALATPVFHTFFGTKWDPSIVLFQMLLVRGIFTVLNALYTNYLLALSHARAIFWLEVLRDGTALVALAATLPFMAWSTPADPVAGLRIMLWGQLAASALTWGVTLVVTCRAVQTGVFAFVRDLAPYATLTLAIIPVLFLVGGMVPTPVGRFVAETLVAVLFYIGANALAGSVIQREVFAHFSR